MTAPIRSMPELVDAFRVRRDGLNIAHSTIEDIGLLPDGYVSKVLSENAGKNIGPKALEGLLDGLDAYLELRPNPSPSKRFKERFAARKRPPKAAASLIFVKREEMAEISEQLEGFARMQILGRAGGMASGKKRQKKAMKRRALQRVRAHAARMRWAKVKA